MKALLAAFFIGYSSWALHAQSVSKVVVYQAFFPVGTTVGLTSAFRHPARYPGAVVTTDINHASILKGADFSRLLSTAKRKKHHQMKIAGIRCAGEMEIAGATHFFLYCYPSVLIDLTDRANYFLDRRYQHALDLEMTALLKGK